MKEIFKEKYIYIYYFTVIRPRFSRSVTGAIRRTSVIRSSYIIKRFVPFDKLFGNIPIDDKRRFN